MVVLNSVFWALLVLAGPEEDCGPTQQYSEEQRLDVMLLRRMATEPPDVCFFDRLGFRREHLAPEPPNTVLELRLGDRSLGYRTVPQPYSFLCLDEKAGTDCFMWVDQGLEQELNPTLEDAAAQEKMLKVQGRFLELKRNVHGLAAGPSQTVFLHRPGKNIPAIDSQRLTYFAAGTCPTGADLLLLKKALTPTAQLGLSLESCELDEAFISSLPSLVENLRALRFKAVKLPAGAWKAIGGLHRLEGLYLEACDLSTFEPFRVVPRLRVLSLKNATGLNVGGSLLRTVVSSKKLKFLDLSGMSIADRSFETLADLGPDLEELRLAGAELSAAALSSLYLMQSLRALDLSGTTADEMTVLSLGRLERLRRLELTGTTLSGAAVATLFSRLSLIDLVLPAPVEKGIFTGVLQLQGLRILHLPGAVDSVLLSTLYKIRTVIGLDFPDAEISRETGTWFESWPGLRYVAVRALRDPGQMKRLKEKGVAVNSLDSIRGSR